MDGDATDDNSLYFSDGADNQQEHESSMRFINQYLNQNDDVEMLKKAICKLRKFIACDSIMNIEKAVKYVYDVGYIPRIIELLSHQDDGIVYEASWAMTNVVSGSGECTEYCVKNGLIMAFMQVIDRYIVNEKNFDLVSQPIWGMGNICGENIWYRDFVIQRGLISRILVILSTETTIAHIRTAVWTLSNLLRGNPFPGYEYVEPCIPILTGLLKNYTSDVLISDVLWCLCFITDNPNCVIENIIQDGIANIIIELMHNTSTRITVPAVRMIGICAGGTDHACQILLDSGVLMSFKILLNEPNRLRKEVLWGLSNIAAGTSEQIQEIIDSDILPIVSQILMSPSEVDTTKRESGYVISNVLSRASPEQVNYVSHLEYGVPSLLEYATNISPKTDMFLCIIEVFVVILEDVNARSVFKNLEVREIFEDILDDEDDDDIRNEITGMLDLLPCEKSVNWSPELHSSAPDELSRIIETILLLSQVDPETGRPIHPSEDNQLHFWYIPKEIVLEILSKLQFTMKEFHTSPNE